MPKTEGFHILDVQSDAIMEDKAKNSAGLHPQNVVRKKLADISNQPQNQRLLIQEKSQSIETTAKEYISQLREENMALVKMLQQRNNIIEQNGNELDRLRVNMLKMHEQNQQLALSNSQMLMELNSGKDRLKTLQHELGCKAILLKAKNLDLKGREMTKPLEDSDAKLINSEEELEFSKEGIDDDKPHGTTSSFQQNGEYQYEQVESMNKTENNRPFLRRQSSRFRDPEVKPAEDLFETNKNRVFASQLPENTVQVKGSSSESAAAVKHEGSTLHRPSRAATKKVQSYKELSVKVKLRRPE